ncbi:hypothetical protein, partial [Pseudomaricurvus sp.]|uniref:hypothetical protein n=1 Tax=Pseudomaricurvus sp. TaxID=2004510 RepID=UPI003F6AC4F9
TENDGDTQVVAISFLHPKLPLVLTPCVLPFYSPVNRFKLATTKTRDDKECHYGYVQQHFGKTGLWQR